MKVESSFYYYFIINIIHRAAFLSGRIVEIRGLSSYLTYFEGAITSHVNSIVHTRQSKAPVPVPIVYNPFIITQSTASLSASSLSILKFDASSPSHHHLRAPNIGSKKVFDIVLELSSSVESRVVILLNFRPSALKKLLQGNKSDGLSDEKRLRSSLLQMTPMESVSSSGSCYISTRAFSSESFAWEKAREEKIVNMSQVSENFMSILKYFSNFFLYQLPSILFKDSRSQCCDPVAWVVNISTGVHRIRFEKELDGPALSQGSFYPVGVLVVPLSSSPLHPSSSFGASMVSRDVESGLGWKTGSSLTPTTRIRGVNSANDEAPSGLSESERRKPLHSRLMRFDLNPFKILSGAVSSNRVSDPTGASSQRLSPQVLQSRQLSGGTRVADDAASDRSTAGLLGKSDPAVHPAVAEPPPPSSSTSTAAAAAGEEGESESVECPLEESTGIVTAIFSLRFPVHKLLPTEIALSGAPSPPTGASTSSLPSIQTVSTLVPKEIKVAPTELMILDTNGHVYLSREIFGLGSSAAPVANTANSNPSPLVPNGDATEEVKRDVVVTDLGDPSERRGSLSGSLNSSAGTSSLGSLHAGAVQDIDRRGAKNYERLSSSTGGDEEDQVRASSLSGEGQPADEQKVGEPSSATSAGPAPVDNAAVETALTIGGGKYVKEECVVCFTDHKEVMLLPCR